jgi:hypothetical protein
MDNEPRFEEKYEDVLQNIEFGIVGVYRKNPEVSDWDALDAVEALIRRYTAEERNRVAPAVRLSVLAQQIFDAAGAVCEWRLGREELLDQKDQPPDLKPEPNTVGEIVACLKRIRRSIRLWDKQGGRQGYLNFVRQFLP